MITLKAALIAAGAIGTVAVGGGATWAMTGSHENARLQSGDSALPAAHRAVDAPKPAPACPPASELPMTGKLPKSGLPKTGPLPATGALPGNRELPKTGLPKTGLPKTGELPKGKAPSGELPAARKLRQETDALKKNAEAAKPGTPARTAPPSTLPSIPAKLPACAPSAKPLPKGGTPATDPSARVPGKPAHPAAPALDCRKLAPAVQVGGPVEKAVMLPKGLRYVSATPGTADLKKLHICAVTQKWTGKAGQWLTVERLKTPTGMTQNQLRRALRLPGGGTPLTIAGVAAYQGPDGGGVLMFDPNGYSLYVNGSRVLTGGPNDLAGGTRDIATALRQAHQ
jgi:hypothetical protein